MKFGLNNFPLTPKLLFPMALRADEVGIESFWVGEHPVLPVRIESPHPYYPDLGPPLPETPLYDPLIVLSYIAAQTKRIKLCPGVYLTALRHPILAARLLVTLDRVSGGRVLFGTGIGWIKEEFDALAIPWERRGARMDECIAVMRRLWSEHRVAHEGEFYRFEEVGFQPKPVNGTIPVLVGGEAPSALRRAARIGDGWVGLTETPERAAQRIAELNAMRDGAPLEITVAFDGVPSLDDARRFRDAGVHRLTFIGRQLSGGGKTIEDMLGGLDRFAEEVIDRIST